ncbi:retrovirus-related pol polyprotein from transposon TNT 1-94, partial [Tanacetum coccineum]
MNVKYVQSYDHSTSGHNNVILVRGGVLAESSQSRESSIDVSCPTYGSNVHSTTDHNDFEHFKRETHQGALLVPRRWMLKEYDWCQELSAQICGATRKYLHLLHMDLFGPVDPMSINHKKYTLVIVDEYSRTDNGTEFRNSKLESFYNEKGISQNFSSLYTPEQNGAAERKNKTLIEATRKMLNGLVLSKHFWIEAVRIAYYTQNRSIIVKRHDKTPYEIFRERIPDINYFHISEDTHLSLKPSEYLTQEDNKLRRLIMLPLMREDDPFIQYQSNYDISYYIIPHGRSLTKLTQENHVLEVIAPNKQDTPHTEDVEGNNTETSVPINEPLVPEVSQSQSTHQASTSSYPVAQDRWSRDQHIKLVNIIGDPGEGMLTRSMATKLTATSTKLKHPGWIDSMQEELNQFYRNKVWSLVPLPYKKIAIGSKWVFRNKKDKHGTTTKNRTRLVAQGYSQEEGIDYDETFALVA